MKGHMHIRRISDVMTFLFVGQPCVIPSRSVPNFLLQFDSLCALLRGRVLT